MNLASITRSGTSFSNSHLNSPVIQRQLDEAAAYKANGSYENALEIYTDLAEQKIPEAQYWKGVFLKEGLGTGQDFKAAFELFQLAANQEFTEAHVELGRMYAYGKFVNRNGDKAIEHFKLAGENGKAKLMLGLLYAHGNVVARDLKQAIVYLNKALELGETEACSALGICYHELGEDNLAFKYTVQAVESGNSMGWYNLGCWYERGIGVKPDISKAIDCYKRAGQLGIAYSWDELEKLLKQTGGDLKEFRELKQYYTTIPNYSTQYAYTELGRNYNLFKQRALQKDPIAIYNLGMMNLEGRGTKFSSIN